MNKIVREPGIYVIRCKSTGKNYVGVTENLRRRVASHFSALQRGRHDVRLIQQDWDRFGPSAFECYYRPLSVELHDAWEQALTLLANGLEHAGGYNKKLGPSYSLCSQIRDTERKLRRQSKFYYLRSIHPDDALSECYLKTFQRDGPPQPVYRSEHTNHPQMQIGQGARVMLLSAVLTEFRRWSPNQR